ncbi:arylesterase [Synechococcus sp. CS-602]|uniref:GDSL-type esterase/lipase family protein n=1 Tax=Synechococcaceae TaxID=1890426 RepID=UPI0008FF0D65|nr:MULTISPECIES: GDSL-type esterase/lipase family protein [Synechococcaceae]MCT4365460.1 GDSL-type esterase/lipase family protein [Candidatus Regnicoccus frigidus MAG-AL1]APD47508.1 arylesterase [Synechococcus sp. SynAce01]MCT0202526.1 arylesterase [Synechococcus sp. CS-603]MCT0204330.1 arylesterase [Synechococcus sp. CS-602]MCT0247172.1 arylesterase [Synechococcus sp. CS-601]
MPEAIPRKLVVLGDSSAYGWGDPDEGGWCERLRRHWMQLPGGPVLYNLGVRGDGLERLAARLPSEVGCRGELRRQLPQGILINIGFNDSARVGRPDGRHQLAPEAFLFGLQQLLRQAKAQAPVLVIGLSPVDGAVMPYAGCLWYELAALRRYERLLEEACLEEDVPFLPLLEPLLGDPHWLRLIDGDGVHLNGAGHQRIFERVRQWPALLRWAGLEPLVACTPSA